MRRWLARILIPFMCISVLEAYGNAGTNSAAENTESSTIKAASETENSDSEDSLIGQRMQNFSVETVSGETFTLSEALNQKKAVLINFWASWCGPCIQELSILQEAYDQYKDDVAVIALSAEEEDSIDIVKEYAEDLNLTFHIGNDSTVGLSDLFSVKYIPTTVIIDRFGKICYIVEEAETEVEKLTGLFDQVIDDEYTETKALQRVTILPKAERLSSEELSETANADGGTLKFYNSTDETIWPMNIRTVEDRTVLVSTNNGVSESKSQVITNVTAKEGDALVFDFHLSSHVISTALMVLVDGKADKTFSGEYDWNTFAIRLEKGKHEIIFQYEKPSMSEAGDDEAMIDNVKVVSGDEAEELLAVLPVYPTAEETDVQVTGAKEVIFEGDAGKEIDEYWDMSSYWMVFSETAEVKFTIPEIVDPYAASVYNYSNHTYALATDLDLDGKYYIAETYVDGIDEDDGSSYTVFEISPMYQTRLVEALENGDIDIEETRIILFRDENNLQYFIKMMMGDESEDVTWHYAE